MGTGGAKFPVIYGFGISQVKKSETLNEASINNSFSFGENRDSGDVLPWSDDPTLDGKAFH